MPYIICKENLYLRQDNDGFKTITDRKKATRWDKKKSASNVCKNVKVCKENDMSVISVFDDMEIVDKPLDYKFSDKVKELIYFTKEIEIRKEILNSKLSEVDMEIVDIEHAAEFYNLNASQGYKIYKLLHEARVKRREIKNELQTINLILGTTLRFTNMENLEKSIAGIDAKQYTPRVLNELFGI